VCLPGRHCTCSHLSSGRSHGDCDPREAMAQQWPLVCPVCNQSWGRRSAGRKMWSDVQWNTGSPLVVDTNGWNRNCCSACSDVPGEYYCSSHGPAVPQAAAAAAAQGPGPAVDLHQQLRDCATRSSAWLAQHIPHRFWTLFIDFVQSQNQTHREAIAARNIRCGLKPDKSLMKLMSYCGAVRVPQSHAASLSGPWVDVDGTVYWDCTNAVYNEVVLRTWPPLRELGYGAKNMGDVVEAFFGYSWVCRRRGISRSLVVERFLEQLELLSFAVWRLYQYPGAYW